MRWFFLLLIALIGCQVTQPVPGEGPVFAAVAKNLCLELDSGRSFHCFRYTEQLPVGPGELVALATAAGYSCVQLRCEKKFAGPRRLRVILEPSWKGCRMDVEVMARPGEQSGDVAPLLVTTAARAREELGGEP